MAVNQSTYEENILSGTTDAQGKRVVLSALFLLKKAIYKDVSIKCHTLNIFHV